MREWVTKRIKRWEDCGRREGHREGCTVTFSRGLASRKNEKATRAELGPRDTSSKEKTGNNAMKRGEIQKELQNVKLGAGAVIRTDSYYTKGGDRGWGEF